MKCTCQCGYTDTIENMITITPVRKVTKSLNGENYIIHVCDRIFYCPNCGATFTQTGSLGTSLNGYLPEKKEPITLFCQLPVLLKR